MTATAIHSFDVFDTCISRFFYRPTDLHLALARNIVSELSIDVKDRERAVVALANCRWEAEQRARQSSNREDVNLVDIYAEIRGDLRLPIDPDDMKRREIEMECQAVSPIRSTLILWRELAARGEKIIFVSDMYLPTQTVRRMLVQAGYSADRDALYVSGEVGLTKRTGNLYKYILREAGVAPEEIVHYGDHPVSDISKPRSLGIQVRPVRDIHKSLYYENGLQGINRNWQRLSDRLQRASRMYRKFYKHPLSKRPVDQQLALSSAAACARLLFTNRSLTEKGSSTHHALAYFIAAPLFNAYAYWVIEKARELGISRLYFVARNGQVFQQIVERICRSKSYEIECRYLYGSRAAWYPPSFGNFDDTTISMLLEKYRGRTVREILEDLGLGETETEVIMAFLSSRTKGADTSTSRADVSQLLKIIARSETVRIMEEHFYNARQTVFDYLKQQGFFESGKTAIVDIGWHLSTHQSLARICGDAEGASFYGFYFGIGRRHHEVDGESPFYCYYSDIDSRRHSWLFRLGAMQLLEEVFATADHGTTRGYTRRGARVEPVVSESGGHSNTVVLREIRSDILEFTDHLLATGMGDKIYLAGEDVLYQFERFYKYPLAREVRAIAATETYALTSHSASQKRSLATELSMVKLLNIVGSVVLRGRDLSPDWLWLQGSTAISGNLIAKIGLFLSFLESVRLRLED